ncbi:MAG: hypothetical protein AMXMBFR7_04170 [Planctomycetota bacterium]
MKRTASPLTKRSSTFCRIAVGPSRSEGREDSRPPDATIESVWESDGGPVIERLSAKVKAASTHALARDARPVVSRGPAAHAACQPASLRNCGDGNAPSL